MHTPTPSYTAPRDGYRVCFGSYFVPSYCSRITGGLKASRVVTESSSRFVVVVDRVVQKMSGHFSARPTVDRMDQGRADVGVGHCDGLAECELA